MTDPDRLAEITARFHAGKPLSQEDAGWLIADLTIKRGLLARLEWAGRKRSSPDRNCPACFGWPANGHDPDCWLAAELTRTTSPGPPEGVERPGT
jgi:hypothetical protein